MVDHKEPFNKASSPKQIKCIDKTNKLVLGTKSYDISPYSVPVDAAVLLNVAGLR